MLGFCLGCGNKKCWVWFLALIFLLLTFLFFWGNPYEAIQPVKTTIFSRRKITFKWELASYLPVFLHYSWIFDWYINTNCFSLYFKLKTWCLILIYYIRPFSGPCIGRFRSVSSDFLEFFCQNSLIQVWKSMLKHRTHPGLYKSSRLKVDFLHPAPSEISNFNPFPLTNVGFLPWMR